ncbi:MAG: hypothetical protein U9R66_05250 [Thermodesulfobacteriota bacterium]|nr:hypothetical protein [Thermodesulfobacteriota bacterium]
MQYTIYDAPKEKSQEGSVWIKQSGIRQNSIVKIKLKASGKYILCEAKPMDYDFLKNYERQHPGESKIDRPEQSIVMNLWYRSCLNNLKVKNEYDIEITSANLLWDKINACRQHPQISVRSTTWLGLTSLALGTSGLFLGIISLL